MRSGGCGIGVLGIAALLVLGAAEPGLAAGRTPRDPVQDQLDAMTSHDLCARDDAALLRLNRALSKGRRQAAKAH